MCLFYSWSKNIPTDTQTLLWLIPLIQLIPTKSLPTLVLVWVFFYRTTPFDSCFSLSLFLCFIRILLCCFEGMTCWSWTKIHFFFVCFCFCKWNDIKSKIKWSGREELELQPRSWWFACDSNSYAKIERQKRNQQEKEKNKSVDVQDCFVLIVWSD